jgi:hypothetical protein
VLHFAAGVEVRGGWVPRQKVGYALPRRWQAQPTPEWSLKTRERDCAHEQTQITILTLGELHQQCSRQVQRRGAGAVVPEVGWRERVGTSEDGTAATFGNYRTRGSMPRALPLATRPPRAACGRRPRAGPCVTPDAPRLHRWLRSDQEVARGWVPWPRRRTVHGGRPRSSGRCAPRSACALQKKKKPSRGQVRERERQARAHPGKATQAVWRDSSNSQGARARTSA